LIIKKKIPKEEIERCLYGNGWDFGNRILYEMCEENPYHKSANIIVGKVWLIGRSYAAAIERRKNANNNDLNDDFYFNVVAPKMMEIGKEIDERIVSLKKYSKISTDNLKEIIETHKFLTDVFSTISGLSKRSLASKYLHFHVPRMFFIYDSRAMKGARNYIDSDKILYRQLISCGDKEYLQLVTRLFPLQEHFKNEYNLEVTPRIIDSLLLKY
jgi:hypothetical protein